MSAARSLAAWLARREAADHAARDHGLTRAVRAALPGHRPLRVLDLATGTGSNVRYLAARLPVPQEWHVVDRSLLLLGELRRRMAAWASARGLSTRTRRGTLELCGAAGDIVSRIHTHRRDLADLRRLDLLDGCDLVTASALLDLVSRRWLYRLAARCRAAGAVVLIALTYDGRFRCVPAEPEDELVRRLLNRHQRRNLGIGGRAAGPSAVREAIRAFRATGFAVRTARTPWRLGPDRAALQRALVAGWVRAAVEVRPTLAGLLRDWQRRRLAHIAAGRSRLLVGHADLAAWPRASRGRALRGAGG